MEMKKMSSLVLLSTLVLSAAVPTVLAADPDPETTATIEYTSSTTSAGLKDPEDMKKVISVADTEGKKGTGELMIEFVPHLRFGSAKITPVGATHNATPTTITRDSKQVTRGNFLEITDQRGGGKKGWQLKATLAPLKNGTNVLPGAKISFANPFVAAGEGNPATATAQTLVPETQVTMMESADSWGTHAVEYGRPALDADGQAIDISGKPEATKATADTSVSLYVGPGQKLTGTYSGSITWSLIEKP